MIGAAMIVLGGLFLVAAIVLLVRALLIGRRAGRMPTGHAKADEHWRSSVTALYAALAAVLASMLSSLGALAR